MRNGLSMTRLKAGQLDLYMWGNILFGLSSETSVKSNNCLSLKGGSKKVHVDFNWWVQKPIKCQASHQAGSICHADSYTHNEVTLGTHLHPHTTPTNSTTRRENNLSVQTRNVLHPVFLVSSISINWPKKLICKFKLSPSFLLCSSQTVCIKIYLIPLWHNHSSHWDLWEKKGHRNRIPQSERKCVSWIMSTNIFQWDCHCREQKDILWSFSSKRFISHCIYGSGENTKKDKYLPKRKTITVKASTAFYILYKVMEWKTGMRNFPMFSEDKNR